MRRNLFLVVYLVLFISVACAQDHKPWAGFGIEAHYVAGQAFKHTKKVRTDFPAYSPAYDINFIQQTYGRKEWHQRRKYPVIGLGLTYTVFDNDAVYGKMLSIYPNIRIPLLTAKKLEWSVKAGFGVGYITKIFERYPSWDTLNNVIGSRMNNYTYAATELRYRVNEHLDIQCGINFSHASNAALRSPNLGINKYGAHIGVRYSPVTSEPKKIVHDLQDKKNRVLFHLRFGIAGSEMGTADGPMNPIYNATFFASKRYWSKNKLFAGIDYAYYQNIYRFLKNNEIEPGREKQNSWKSTVFIGNEFLIGSIGIVFQLGYYIRKGMLTDASIYEKLGGNVYLLHNEKGILKELTLHALLKAHTPDAEMVELGLGAAF